MRRRLFRIVLVVAVAGVLLAVVDLLKTLLVGDAGTGEKVLAGALVVVLLVLAAPIFRAARR